jgi:hypothetical protein
MTSQAFTGLTKKPLEFGRFCGQTPTAKTKVIIDYP